MNKTRKIILILFALAAILPLGLLIDVQPAQAATCGTATPAPILTVNSAQIGSANSWNSGYYLYVQFNTGGSGWKVEEAYFHPSTYLGGLPRNSDGTLDYTRFAHRRVYSSPVTSNTFSVRRDTRWLDGSEMHMGMYLKLVKLNSAGQVISRTGAWVRTKNVNNAWYFKHMMWWCTPHAGSACQSYFWGSSSHYSKWQGYTPNQNFNTVFGRNALGSSVTLGQALNLTGGSVNYLARHAAAALLNSVHTNVDYPYARWKVLDLFRKAYDYGNFQSSGNVFYYANNIDLSCSLR